MKKMRLAGIVALFPCLALAQLPSSSIWLGQLQWQPQAKLLDARAITDNKGYRNQPYFLGDGSGLLYSASVRHPSSGEQTDIFFYRLTDGKQRNLTNTKESEYSPTPMADARYFSVVRVEQDSRQRLWRFDRNGRRPPEVLLPELDRVGYHSWLDSKRLLLFLLGKPAHELHVAELGQSGSRKLDDNIGASLQPLATGLGLYSRQSQQGLTLWKYHDKTGQRTLIGLLPTGARYFTTATGGLILSASGSQIWFAHYHPGKVLQWYLLADMASLCLDISRLALSPDKKQLAWVCMKETADA